MDADYKKGIKTGLIVYLIGIGLVVLTHLVFGWDNPHAPPTSFVVILALLILGVIRLIKNASNIFYDREKEKSKGEVLIHLNVFGLVTLFIIWVFLASG